MLETFVLSFVEKLTLLEKAAGSRVSYGIMPPISTPLDDCMSIQKAARQLAGSISLSQFTFIVTFVKQKKNVGGHIELNRIDEVVFIEIDPGALALPESIGAILCHEIAHKWLQVNQISSPIEMDNEILTDIATVFLGFGRIMLNGCDVMSVKEERTAEGTRTTTQTRISGYLKRDQLAFVYRMVCAMRNVPQSECMRGLSSAAADAMCACDSAHGHYYSPRFHQVETIGAALKRVRTEAITQQRQLAELNKHLEYVTRSFCDTVNNFITAAHKTIDTSSKKSEALVQEAEHDPVLRFLHAIKKEHDLEKMAQELASVQTSLKPLLAHSTVIGRHIRKHSSQFPSPSSIRFNVVKFPKDGTKLRLPQDSPDLIVACPTCHYRFAYNTMCVSFEPSSWVPRFMNWWRTRLKP